MKKFLISGIGGDIAQSIAKIIRLEFKNATIDGIDPSNRNAATLFCDEFFTGLKADDKEYLSFIEEFIQKRSIDVFIPCSEHELRAIAKLSPDHPIWKKILSCSPQILTICLDKLKTFQFLDQNNISVPWYAETASQIPADYPCIYKKRNSSGSRDIFQIRSIEEALFFEKYSPSGLFQEFLPNHEKEYTCSVFRWTDGTFQCLQLLRTLTGGATSWAKVDNDPEINRLCLCVAEAFELTGSLNIQLRLTKKGPRIFEINPRFSSTVYMRHLIGFPDLVWSIHKMFDKNFIVNAPQIKQKTVVKIFDAVVL